MAIELATAYVTLTTSARGIEDSVNRQLGGVRDTAGRVGNESGQRIASGVGAGGKRAAGVFGDTMKTVGSTIGGYFAVDKITDFFSSAIDEAKESAKVSALTAQVIKTTGSAAHVSAGQVGDLATNISNYAGIDDEAVQSGENFLLTFTNIKNGVGKGNDIFNQATKAMADLSVATGKDMTVSATLLGKALNDPIHGVGALSKVGVSFTDQQKAQIKALVKSGDTMGAQKVILAELSKEYGGAAAAAASPAQKLEVAWGNFKEQIGTSLMPLLAKFVTFMTGDVLPVLSSVAGWLDRNSAIIKPIAVVVGVLVAAWATYTAVTTVATAAQAAFNAVMAINPVTWVVLAIIALIAVLVVAYMKVGWFRDGVNAAFTWIKLGAEGSVQGIIAAWDWVKNAAGVVKDWIVTKWNETLSFFRGLPGKITSIASGMWNGMRSSVTGAYSWVVGRLQAIVSFVTGIPGRVAGVLRGLFQPLIDAARTVLGAVARVWNATLGSVSFTIPSWVPGLGGNSYSFPHMASFARGGMLQPGWNVVGENGTELVYKAGSSAQVFSRSASQDITRNEHQQGPVTVGTLVEFSGPLSVRSDQDVLELSRGIAREANRRLRSLGVGVSLSGATA